MASNLISESPTSAAILNDGAPNWDAITFDVACGRCGYNLRTLTRPKCTECGLDFTWPEVLDQAAHESDFLFEHNWQERPMRSWLATVCRSFRPKKFWSELSLHSEIRTAPLFFLLISSIVVFFVVLHGASFLFAIGLREALNFVNSKGVLQTQTLWNIHSILKTFGNLSFTWKYWLIAPVTVAIPFVATIGILSLLDQTLARCHVRHRQLLRVVVYAYPLFCTCFPLLMVLIILPLGELELDFEWGFALACLCFSLPGIFLFPHLSNALSCYLHLPRPKVISLVTVFAALLASFTFLISVSAYSN